ncbi:unnamed protein product [Paramecium sonneborni]|uniref:Uncharacterized protein n=1 Tax=Paramecium sonneborni TaxID=65129 RepID=A0A8S1L6N1_9CILI|nr:unnamed protein product [Paramecium sonneborni]
MQYDYQLRAFLQKRWTQKHEIPGRMYVIQQIEDIKDQLQIQQLQPLKILLSETRLKNMYDNDQMDSQYIISIISEEHFKPMMDEYTKKVLINGAMPPLIKYDQYNQIRNQILQLYQVFFFGDPLSQLEREIEFRYLALKQKKFFKYQIQQRSKDKCLWTHSQQRRVELMKNWMARDINLYDDLRPIYEPLLLNQKIQIYQQLMKIDEVSIKEKLLFHLLEKHALQKSKRRLLTIAQTLFTRTMLYTNCIEFLRVLDIPPDFHIELSIINVHIWLICNRLQQINTRESNNLATLLFKACDRYISEEVDKIHLRKKHDLVRDIEAYMQTSRKYLEYHFNRNIQTVKNNYFKLDALIWSIIFFEKIPRYSDKVYLVAEYIKSNYDFLNSLSYQSFEDCVVEFDIFKMKIDYKTQLLQVNPPLSEKEFEQEFLSDNKIKKYYYSFEDQENKVIELPKFESQIKSLLERRLDVLGQNIRYVIKKYQNLDTYDHFSTHEEQIKQEEKKQKYIWNKSLERDPEDLRKQLKQRRIQQKNM